MTALTPARLVALLVCGFNPLGLDLVGLDPAVLDADTGARDTALQWQ